MASINCQIVEPSMTNEQTLERQSIFVRCAPTVRNFEDLLHYRAHTKMYTHMFLPNAHTAFLAFPFVSIINGAASVQRVQGRKMKKKGKENGIIKKKKREKKVNNTSAYEA